MWNWKKQLISLRWIILLQFIQFCSSVVWALFLFEVNKSMEFPLTTNTAFSRQPYTRGQNKINPRHRSLRLTFLAFLWFGGRHNHPGGGEFSGWTPYLEDEAAGARCSVNNHAWVTVGCTCTNQSCLMSTVIDLVKQRVYINRNRWSPGSLWMELWV